MILAGDVGGTKVVLALFEDTITRKKLKEQKFASKDFSNFGDIVREFLPSGTDISCASFGIAGPIINNKCHATNLPWVVDREKLQKLLKIETVYLINDLKANAWGCFVLRDDEFFVLNKGIEKKDNRVLISAGTGLGEAGFYFDGKEFYPVASEGGHAGFSPSCEEEVEIWRYFKKQYEHVSFERILSGRGIVGLYNFYVEEKNEPEIESVRKRMLTEDPAKVISEHGIAKSCPTCVKTLKRFSSIYGGEAANLALKYLATGGVYVGGGIAPKILDILKEGEFMEAFVAKGRFASILSDTAVKIILNPETALLGAAEYAKVKGSRSYREF